MRTLIRPEIPRILREKQREWTEKLEASGGKRPDASKYGHAEIKRALRSMSFNKCSYCEGAITESEGNVEHRLGVTPAERAFEWANLYWACKDCNNAKKELTPERISTAIDPANEAIDPTDHLDFEDELIRSYRGSPLGQSTIGVHDLDREQLAYRRLKRLTVYRKRREDLRADPRSLDPRWFDQQLRALLEAFAARDQPFSAMFVARMRGITPAITSPTPAADD